jgi:glycosyltransferase involved in cell wall biosynthesis
MERKRRIGLLVSQNPFNRKSFSGTPYYMLRALQAEPDLDVRVLGGYRAQGLVDRLRRRPPTRFDVEAGADDEGLDWIVGLTSLDLLERFSSGWRTPFAYITDATPQFLREFYGLKLDLGSEEEEREVRVMGAAQQVIFSSRYMADRAIRELGLTDTDKVADIPFGLNLDEVPVAPPPKPPLDPLRLLYIGKHWRYKGGDTAIEALRLLRARGVDARLSMIGEVPEEFRREPGVEAWGYLDKSKWWDYRRLLRLLRESHLFVLPTRADCTPMVVAEANAYGLPVLISDIGGIGSLMAPGRNGEMLPGDAGGAAYADRIMALTADRAAYEALSRSSFEHCRDRLTWSAWTRELIGLLRSSGRPVQRAAVRTAHG